MKVRRRHTDDYLIEFVPHVWGIGFLIDGDVLQLSLGPFHVTWWWR